MIPAASMKSARAGRACSHSLAYFSSTEKADPALTTPGPDSRGIDVHEATFAYGLLDAFVYGFVLQETARPYASPEEFGDVAADMADVMPAEDYPHLAAAAAELTTSGYDLADQFDEALDLVLDAIETRWAGTVA